MLNHFCVYCGEPLSIWENTRSYCWNCNELTTSEASHEEHDDNWFDLVFQSS